MSNLNSLQSTIKDLKEIIQKNQGANEETSVLVTQMEQLVAEIEQKSARGKKQVTDVLVSPVVHTVPVV